MLDNLDVPDDLPEIDEQQSVEITVRARDYQITTDSDLSAAAQILQEIRAWRDEIERAFNPAIRAAHDAHKKILAAKNERLAPLVAAETDLKGRIGEYQIERDRARRVEEICRLDAEREAWRARRREEIARLQEAAAAKTLAAASKKEAARIAAQTREQVDIIQSAPLVIETPAIAAAPPTDGISARKKWSYRIANESLIPRKYLAVDAQKIGKAVRALGPEAEIPGVEVYEERTIAVQRRLRSYRCE